MNLMNWLNRHYYKSELDSWMIELDLLKMSEKIIVKSQQQCIEQLYYISKNRPTKSQLYSMHKRSYPQLISD